MLDKYFKEIYCFNLKKRNDRLTHIKNQLKKINCKNYNIIESVDGYSIPNPTSLKNGMYGLVKTYLKLYDRLKNKDYNDLVIIEDDCIFSDDFVEKGENLINNVPDDWEMLYFGGNHNTHVGERQPMNINKDIIKLHNTYSAHCVVLKKHVFEDLINTLKTFSIENDVFMAKLQKKYKAYSTKNKITWQLPGESNIENRVVNYDWILKK